MNKSDIADLYEHLEPNSKEVYTMDYEYFNTFKLLLAENEKLEKSIRTAKNILNASYFESSKNIQEHFNINGVREAIKVLNNE